MFIVLRLISLILIVAGLMLMGADLVTTLEKGGVITVRHLDQVWALFDKNGAAAVMGWLGRNLPSIGRGIQSVPAWAAIGVPGIILAFVFGRRSTP